MNDFIKKINKRVSIRDYEPNKKIPHDQVNAFVEVVNNAPTSNNGQYFGVVFVEDPKMLELLFAKVKFSNHVRDASIFAIFFIENNQLEGMVANSQSNITANKTNLFATAVVDATIAATSLQDAAVSLGLGTCFIGMVRAIPSIIMEKLNLPKGNIPIIGLTIGFKISEDAKKPKMNKVYFNKYDANAAISELNNYDNIMNAYYKKSKYYLDKSGNDKNVTHSSLITSFYQNKTWDTDWDKLIKDLYFKK